MSEILEIEEVDSYPPWNFSWVIPKELAAMAYPRNKENLKFLVEEGIKHLVTLCPEKKPPIEECKELKWKEIAVDPFDPPSMKNIKEFLDFCTKCRAKGEAVAVHCRQGRGRTGVMLACHFMASRNLSPHEAMAEVRLLRPGSCITEELEDAVIRYHDCLRGTANVDDEVFKPKFIAETNGEAAAVAS